MAQTRATTGHSRPRVFDKVEEAVTGTKKPRKTGATATANTSKPRAKTTASGRVGKTSAPATKKTSTTGKSGASKVGEKVEGAVLKAEGKLTGRPGKKAAGTAKLKGTEKKAVGPKTKVAKV